MATGGVALATVGLMTVLRRRLPKGQEPQPNQRLIRVKGAEHRLADDRLARHNTLETKGEF